MEPLPWFWPKIYIHNLIFIGHLALCLLVSLSKGIGPLAVVSCTKGHHQDVTGLCTDLASPYLGICCLCKDVLLQECGREGIRGGFQQSTGTQLDAVSNFLPQHSRLCIMYSQTRAGRLSWLCRHLFCISRKQSCPDFNVCTGDYSGIRMHK